MSSSQDVRAPPSAPRTPGPQPYGSGYRYTTLDPPNALVTSACGINNAGEIVGRFSEPLGGEDLDLSSHGFTYQGGTFTTADIGYADVLSYNHGISNGGQIVGNYDGNHVMHGFVTNPFANIDVPFAYWTQPYGINRAGEIVGESIDKFGNSSGFLYVNGDYIVTETIPMAINDAGHTVNIYTDNSGVHGLLGRDPINFPSAANTWVRGINNANQIVGSYDFGGGYRHGFMTTHGSFFKIDFPSALDTEACGINDAGEIAGTYSDQSGTGHGFLATPK